LAGQAAITPDGTALKAYLNYIFLDKNFNPGNLTTGFERLPSVALNNYQLLEIEILIDRDILFILQLFNYYIFQKSNHLEEKIVFYCNRCLKTLYNIDNGFSI